jgi:YbbR domain-containing protein
MEISSEAIPRVQVRLRGAGHIVRELQPADVQAEIELGNLKPGERTFDLTSQQIHQPSGLEVVQLIPSQLHVTFDLRITRQVAVHPRIIGTFASGYELGQIAVEPPVVTVIGPRERLEAVDAAMTDPIDVSGAVGSIKFSRHAYVSDPLIQVARPQPVRITVIMRKVSPPTDTPKAPQ